jgi:hypothetical protein
VKLSPAAPDAGLSDDDADAAKGNLKYTAHGFDAELSLMFFNKDILHFKRFAKYVAAFWRIASSSACSASWRLRRAFSAASSFSRSEDESCCCCLLRQL